MNAPYKPEPLFAWALKTGHWHGRVQHDGDSHACAAEARRASNHLASLPPERRAMLEREWL